MKNKTNIEEDNWNWNDKLYEWFDTYCIVDEDTPYDELHAIVLKARQQAKAEGVRESIESIERVRNLMPGDHPNIDERVSFYAACNELEKALSPTE